MPIRLMFVPVAAALALTLAACNDTTDTPEEPATPPANESGEAAPADDGYGGGDTATAPDATPAAEPTLSQRATELARDAREEAGVLAERAGETVAGALESAENAVSDAAARLSPGADWQTAFSPDVPYYNMATTPVAAYSEAGGTEVVATIEPGAGGFIDTCNEALDWCALTLGDGTVGWVEMEQFGGVAN